MANGDAGGGNLPLEILAGLLGALLGGGGGRELTPEEQQAIIDNFLEQHGIDTGGHPPSATDVLTQSIDTLTKAGVDTVNSVGSKLSDFLGGLLSDGIGGVASAATSVIQQIGATSNTALTIVRDTGSGILGQLGDRARGILDTASAVFGGTSNIIEELIRGNINLVEALERAALDAIAKTLDKSSTSIADSLKKVNDAAAEQIAQATHVEEQTSAVIIDSLNTQSEIAKSEAATIQSGLSRALDQLAGVSDSALEHVAQSTDQQTLAIGALGDQLTEGQLTAADRIVAGAFGDSGPSVFSQVKQYLGNEQEGTFDIVISVLRSWGIPETEVQEIHRIVEQAGVDGVLSRWLFAVLFWAQSSLALTQGVGQVALNPIFQRLAKARPSALPSIAEMRALLNRGDIDNVQAIEFAGLQAYAPEVAQALFALRRELPDVGIIQTWFLREFINRDEAKRRLGELGFPEGDSDAFLEMAHFIPPVADLITMAVREVFSPDIAAKFGQFQDFPEDFKKYASLQGVSEFWAQGYWAAHWALPSAEQGFEMLHRDVISRADLDVLLRALDVMPFWREKLTQIAYRPVTRVDIRRMHDLGLIDRAEVKKRYQYLGFAPEDAELMTKFTEAFNSDTQTADPAGLESLSRGTITQLYTRGVLSRGEAKNLMESQGIGGLAAEAYLTNADLAEELRSRDEQTQVVLEQAKAGLLSFGEAQDKLNALGLTANELQHALATLTRQEAQATKIPTYAQLGDMVAAGLITQDEFTMALQAQGYPPYWAERLVQLKTKAKP